MNSPLISSKDYEMPEMTINKRISWKECFLGERMRRWSLWFIITFLAAMTIRDVTLLVLPNFIKFNKKNFFVTFSTIAIFYYIHSIVFNKNKFHKTKTKSTRILHNATNNRYLAH